MMPGIILRLLRIWGRRAPLLSLGSPHAKSADKSAMLRRWLSLLAGPHIVALLPWRPRVLRSCDMAGCISTPARKVKFTFTNGLPRDPHATQPPPSSGAAPLLVAG